MTTTNTQGRNKKSKSPIAERSSIPEAQRVVVKIGSS